MDQEYEINDKWTYIDGELYHAGVKGMQWGKHLPGTDWWKTPIGNKGISSINTSKRGIKGSTANGSSKWEGKHKDRVSKLDGKNRDGSYTVGYYSGESQLARKVNGHNNGNHDPADRSGPLSFGQKWNRFTGNISSKVNRVTKRAGAIARAGYAQARVSAKALGKNISNRASYAAYKIRKGTSKFWNEAKGYSRERVSELSNFAKNAWNNSREAVTNFFTVDGAEREEALNRRQGISSDTPLTRLDTFQNKQLDEAVQAYLDGKDIGSFNEKVDYYIQNAQYGIVKGVNNFLKKIGMDDEVDNFLNKITKRK